MNRNSYSEWSDQELLDLLRSKNDRVAFAAIYDRYWEPLLNMAAKRMQSQEEAEEIVQDVFVSFYRRRQEIEIHTSLEAYLKTALKFQVFKFFRSKVIHENYVQSIVNSSRSYPEQPDSILEARQFREEVEKVLQQLPQKTRDVFMLSRFEQFSQQEIAERLQISVAMVKKHLTKALKLIRTELKTHQYDLLAVAIFVYFGH